MKKLLPVVLIMMALVGCSSQQPKSEFSLEQWMNQKGYVGKTEIPRVQNFRLDSWSYLDKNMLVFDGRGRTDYLVTFSQRCSNLRMGSVLGFVNRIGYLSNLDSIYVGDGSGNRSRCSIDTIFQLEK